MEIQVFIILSPSENLEYAKKIERRKSVEKNAQILFVNTYCIQHEKMVLPVLGNS